jgi:proline iminopeptidase
MAHDAIGLLDALQIRDAHVVGVSMGGMIAQIVAAKHASRVRSLTSIMSTSGKFGLPGPRPRVLRHVLFRHRKNMQTDAMVDYLVGLWALTASPGYPTPVDEKRRLIASWVDRDCDPGGNIRQFAAMAANGDRTPLLRTIRRPTLVVHGADDPLIPAAGGRHTASCISDARLEVVPGMGHDLPEQLMPKMAEMIASHCSEVQNGMPGEPSQIAVNA